MTINRKITAFAVAPVAAASAFTTITEANAQARKHAAMVVRSFVAAPGPEDWRDWMLHTSDDSGEQVFSLPFVSVMGRLH